MLDAATVRYFDASGMEVPRESTVFDMWSSADLPETPLLRAGYIGPKVAEVRVKLPGYAELMLPVEFAPGLKIARTETFISE
jgi:hypothetical protein